MGMSRPSAKQMAFDLDQPSDSASIDLTSAELLGILDEWVAAGWLRAIDRAVAGLVLNHAPDVSPLALLALVLASHQAGQGHVCLDMNACLVEAESALRIPSGDWRGNDIQATPRMTPTDLLQGMTLTDWQAALDACPGVILQSTGSSILGSSILEAPTAERSNPPFVREEGQLYLRRYWQQEQGIVAALRSRLSPHALPADPIRQILDALFPSPVVEPDWQKIACAVAIRQRFSLITGGPGTGKTTTVVKFLMLVQMRALEAGLPPRRIRLCAPTGKAAARLRQSILGQMDALLAPFDAAFPGLRQALPDTVDTVHRLIGMRPNQTHPVYRAENPLPADVVVVDEASMIGVELMAKLLASLDETTQLVLLGDKDQLASVEPGAVLGELSSVIQADAYTVETRDWLAATTGQILPAFESIGPESIRPGATGLEPAADTTLAQAAVQLQHSYRFDSASDIGALARCVNAGDAAGALTLLSADTERASVQLVTDDAGHQPLRHIVRESLAPWLAALNEPMSAENQDERALAIFSAHNRAQVLCALRHGPYGVTGLNRWIEDMLRRSGALSVTGEWYVGRPIMVTRNDPALRLANGEIGITLPYVDPELPRSPPTLRLAFLNEIVGKGDSPIRWIAPGRLTSFETAFALTVHKAQGSEFDHSVLVLPATPSAVLTRELIYTAITRARHRFTLVTAATDTTFNVLGQSITRRVQRSGQLGAKLARPMAMN
jgi:exodeoxyribonuclease V alpha subunit